MLPEEKFSDLRLEQKDAPDESADSDDALVGTVKVLRFLQASCRQKLIGPQFHRCWQKLLFQETDNI